ncbi:hypothetical protein [Candidatus Poriferisodalis sp.]|uniref:hypothetical protein n=1 Tax=Candidatus Poriferisodalis sp. TaxID=3101277 RepID=UPI003D11C28E
MTDEELEDDDGNARVQCIQRDGELHTTTFLAVDPPGCPGGSVGADTSITDPFWQDVWDDRCAAEGANNWDQGLNDGAGGCSGLIDDNGDSQHPCFDGESWVIVDTDTEGCGASQCPVPGDLGNFISGTNGMWDEATQTCGGGGGSTTPGNSDTPGGTVDTELCHDNVYRPAGTCPPPPPDYTPTPTEPRPGNLLACRASSTVRLSWSAVTVANPQTGFDLDGWEIEWGIQGSASTTTASLAKTARSYSRVLSTSNAWTITLTPMLDSGSVGSHSSSIDIPSGDPPSGQCPAPPPLPIPTVMACRSTNGIEVTWTTPPGTGVGTGWVIDVNEWTGSVGHYTSYSITSSNALPWADRAVTLPVPAGQAYLLTVVAYDAGPPARWGSYSTLSDDTAADQPEAGCGPPPPPAVPGGLPDPAPALACLATQFTGRFTSWADSAPANWEREAEYEAEYLDTSSVWRSMPVTVDTTGELIFAGPADSGNAVDVRVRGRGRHREQVGGVWSPWSSWGSWSGWHSHSTPTCPVGAPSPPTVPAAPTLTLACTATQFSSRFTSWADGAPTGWDREAEYEAGYRRNGTTGPWTATPVTTHSSGDLIFTGPSDAGHEIEVRVRGRGRHREQVSGTWSAWSSWSGWSGWHTDNTSPCPVPAPATPPVLPAPTLTLTCGPTQFTGMFTGWADSALANWNRQHEYVAEYRRAGTSGAWTSATVTVLPANQVRISGPADPGHAIDVQVRGRGRHQQQINSTWSAWSSWGTWSGWHPFTTSSCPHPPPPTPQAPTTTIVCDPPTGTITGFVVRVDSQPPLLLGGPYEWRYTVTWLDGYVQLSTAVSKSRTLAVGATSATLTLTIDVSAHSDVLSIRVEAQARRTTPGAPWSTPSPQSAPGYDSSCDGRVDLHGTAS